MQQHPRRLVREAHPGFFPNVLESEHFAIKWGNNGHFSAGRAPVLLQQLERFWAVMTGPELGFVQARGWEKEKRGTHKMNVYVTGECCPRQVLLDPEHRA